MSFLQGLLKLAKEKTYVIRIGMLLIASSIVFIAYLFLETNETLEYQKEIMIHDKKAYIKTAILELTKEAKANIKVQTDNINAELNKAYPKNDKNKNKQLEADLQKYINGDLEITPLSTIMYNNVKGKYFKVNNDNNDPFVVAVVYIPLDGEYYKEYIITSDYSINCLTPNPRTLLEEVNGKQFAKKLVEPAIKGIIEDGMSFTIWHFITPPPGTPWKSYVENLETIDLDELISATDLYGLQFLKGFEFLQAIRLNESSDIANREFVIGGSKANRDAQALYYFGGFNFYDQLTTHPLIGEKIQSFENDYKDNIREANRKKKIYLLFLALDTILVIMSTYALGKKQ